VTTHEPVIPSLLCSESIPSPRVVEAAGVVLANDGNTMLEELPSNDAGTIDPCPGSAWLGAGAGSFDRGVVVDAADVVVLDAVSAVAKLLSMNVPATKAPNTSTITSTFLAVLRFILRRDLIAPNTNLVSWQGKSRETPQRCTRVETMKLTRSQYLRAH
jgi:hypothetical protein